MMAQLSSLPQPLVAGASENIADVVTNLEALRSAVNGIDADQINTGAVGISELTVAITNSLVPVGTVINWYPPNGAAPPWTSVLPTGYAVCDGSAWSTIVNDLGFTSGNIPDLRGVFTAGADPTLARGAVSTNAGVGGALGTNSKALTSGQVPSHVHPTGPAGGHSHGPQEGGGFITSNNGSGVYYNTNLATSSAFGPAYITFTTYLFKLTDAVADHYHSISAPTTNSEVIDFRPATVGLLKIMKVRSAA